MIHFQARSDLVAGDPMAADCLAEFRRVGFAAGNRQGAAWMEDAAARWVNRTGYFALDHRVGTLSFCLWIGNRYGIKQCPGVRVRRVIEQLVAFSKLHQVAKVHHGHTIRYMTHDAEIMRNEQISQVELVA